MERVQNIVHSNIDHSNTETSNEHNDTLCLMGGAALMLFGAGLILSTPMARNYLGNITLSNVIGAAFPDLGRYMRLRAM